jgi:hypothetical protein
MRDDDARGTHVMGALSRQRGRITGTLMNQVSRQSPVLAASNVSAYTAVIPPTQTDLFSYAWFAVNHAGKVLYVPLYMGVTATPRALVSGALFRLANAQRFGVNLFAESKQRGVNLDEFEQEMQADRANMEIVARQALRREGRASAQRVLTEGCLRFAARVERTLRLLGASCSSSSSSS